MHTAQHSTARNARMIDKLQQARDEKRERAFASLRYCSIIGGVSVVVVVRRSTRKQ